MEKQEKLAILNERIEKFAKSDLEKEKVLLSNVKHNENRLRNVGREFRAIKAARALVGPELARVKREINKADIALDHAKSGRLSRKRNALRTSLKGYDMALTEIRKEIAEVREHLTLLIEILREYYKTLG